MRLLLIRHGETPENARGEISSEYPGPGLTEMGERQAAAIPQALEDEPISAIYASTLVRTSITATPLATRRGLPIQVVEGAQEIYAGVWEHRSDEEAFRGYLEPIVAWWHDRSVRIEGGEDGHGFFARFDGAVERIVSQHSDDETVALFSHGAAIRVWSAGTAENLDEESSSGLRLDNTGMVVMEGSPSAGWRMTRWSGQPIGGAFLADGHPDPGGEGDIAD
ncbi:histidine phosphatase family protein [Cnuibacter physcomitrellae]|uniref:histidine phosphatase family protein n=1 Tax=Cnuibacter physcomitrellae TaxID=1619308 RepID=UPI0021758DBF|nr:histidine phosphatase family protein [Cnuibacter physcomitrellae]MCS5499443.1 histidine phosphatase family protein [Cnuibacter physcomitrellae]